MPPLPRLGEDQKFRDLSTFLARTLNPQMYSSVELPQGEVDKERRAWLYYVCFRRRNQFSGYIKLNGALTYTAGGIKGGGKSALIWNISANFRKFIGAYGSKDDEVLAALRAKKYARKIGGTMEKNLEGWDRGLIVGPPTTSVTSSWDYVSYDKLTLNDIFNHDVIVTPNRLFQTPTAFFTGTQRLVDTLWSRPFAPKGQNWFLQIFEAANILYARITMKRAKMDQAKAYLIFLMREMRHMGISMGMDSQYMVSLDREVRTNADYTFIKNMGSDMLPRDIKWMHHWVTPDGLAGMYPDEFVCKDKWGGIYLGRFKLPPWHKEPDEDIYKSLGIKFDFGDDALREELAAEDTEDVQMHKEIVEAFQRIRTIKGTARETGHDKETVKKHVLRHNDEQCSCYRGAT
ncbi:MAG: hypothetical protein KGO96_13085 [Elusimicrobia bacterium]|nr:hypothetical protein [Elusimicrobiota bacterium]MDE2426828.1 hypothetical protein [Elusimicrobiota bacterium]